MGGFVKMTNDNGLVDEFEKIEAQKKEIEKKRKRAKGKNN